MLSASIMILLICVFALTFVPLTTERQLFEVILRILDRSNCPGIVLSLSDAQTENEISLLNLLTGNNRKPITLFTHGRNEIVCNDAIVSCYSNANELSSIYRNLRHHFHLNKVIALTNLTGQADQVLLDAMNERVFVLLEQPDTSIELLRWSVRHNRILRYANLSIFDTRLNLKFSDRQLRIATLHHPPAVVVRTDESGTVLEGIEPSIVKLVAEKLNFTFTYVLARSDEMWGDMVKNKTTGKIIRFTGIRGMLVRKEVDLAFGDLYVMPSWLPHITFSQIYKTDYDCFVVPGPKPLANWMALIVPFTSNTWLATCASLLLITVALFLAGKLNQRNSLIASFIFALGQLLWIQQPRFPDGRTSACRLFLVWCWLFAATILSTVYRSGLISFLTRPFAQQPIDTIQQLVESPLHKMMFSDFYKTVLMNSSDPHRRLLGHQLTATNNISHMMSLLETGQWAVDSSLDSLNYLMMTQSTSPHYQYLHVMKERLFPTRSSFGLQKDSPLKDRIDLVLQRLTEAGLVDYHRSMKPSGRRPPSAAKPTLVRFSLVNLEGAFYLLGIGILISTVAFVIEWILPVLFRPDK
ncbi:hypothetical protein GHT06_013855 [Daphnia sinensis]|uniref:Ionotropic glutamate receptor C-terminal domain-containing protein n=1 Tax=Daphnia sinensis TaxID=1820382 RepID=A0AAD5LL82_9CRUS|nr:hypothetical protein GHT06_013855 [Daphnia sinensis]